MAGEKMNIDPEHSQFSDDHWIIFTYIYIYVKLYINLHRLDGRGVDINISMNMHIYIQPCKRINVNLPVRK